MEAILRLALAEQGAKRIHGTVLEAYPFSKKDEFTAEETGFFLFLKVKTNNYNLADMRSWRLRKAVNLDSFLSAESKAARLAQKEKIKEKIRNAQTGGGVFTRPEDISFGPRWDKVVDLDADGMLFDTPEAQWPKEVEVE